MLYLQYNVNMDLLLFLKKSCLIRLKHHYHMHGWSLVYYVSRLGTVSIDHSLVMAMVERWCQKAYTFPHLVGKATLTLQDLAVILGLRSDGDCTNVT